MIHVPHIHGEALFPREGIAPIDLCPAGNAWLDAMAPCLLWRVQREVVHPQWSRPNQTHVALQHDEQLGQLIEAGLAQEASKPRQPLGVG